MGFSKKLFLSKDLENETPLRTKEELAPLEEWWNRRRKCNEVNYMITGLLLPFWQEMSSKTGENETDLGIDELFGSMRHHITMRLQEAERTIACARLCVFARTHARSFARVRSREK